MKKKIHNFRSGVLFILLIAFFIGSCSIFSGLPEKPVLEPLETNIGFTDPGWANLEINSICVTSDLEMDSNVDVDSAIEIPTQMFEDMGIQTNSDACQVKLNVSGEGWSIPGSYQGVGTCFTGRYLSGKIKLTAEGFPDQIFSFNEDDKPSNSINPNRCTSREEAAELLQNRVKWLLRDAILQFWQPNIYPYVLDHFEEKSLAELRCHDLEPSAEIVPVIIASLDAQGTPRFDPSCLKMLEVIGPDAKEAVPYLIYYLGYFRTNDDERNAISQTLSSITGENIGSNANRWYRWWSKQN